MRLLQDHAEFDLPDGLFQSLLDGRLVVFVGAGVSAKAYPEQADDTWYPLFKPLVDEIAQRHGIAQSAEDERDIKAGALDRVLGRWQGQLPQYTTVSGVHATAAELLRKNDQTADIELHREIVCLLVFAGQVRLVTTNFDRLMERALTEEGLSTSEHSPVWTAPALPPAARYRGLCYLHGRTDRPDEMVLTDTDVGRAYMAEGWALRFAGDLFRTFDVLFVGIQFFCASGRGA